MEKKEIMMLVRSIIRAIKWNINTETSVRGLFGTGSFMSLTIVAREIIKQDHNLRKIVAYAGAGALFGGVYLYLNKTQNNHDLEMEKAKHPRANSNATETPISAQVQPNQIILPQSFVISQHHDHIDYDKRQLVGKLIGLEDICIIYSKGGLGKSVLAFQAANDIALGIRSAIQPDDQGEHHPQTVLYCDAEMREGDYERRYPNFNQPERLQILRGFYFNNENEWLDDIEKRIFEIGVDITVCLDNITGAFQMMNAEQMRYFMVVRLSQIQKKAESKGFHVTFIVLAHTTKEGILAGTSNFQNFATTIIHLKPGPDENYNEIEIDKCRNYGEMMGKRFLLRRSEVGMKHFELECELDAPPSPTAQLKAPVQPVKPVTPKGLKYPRLTETQVEEMRKRVDAGEQKKAVAAVYGIPDSYIDRYLEGKTKPVHDSDNMGDNKEETE